MSRSRPEISGEGAADPSIDSTTPLLHAQRHVRHRSNGEAGAKSRVLGEVASAKSTSTLQDARPIDSPYNSSTQRCVSRTEGRLDYGTGEARCSPLTEISPASSSSFTNLSRVVQVPPVVEDTSLQLPARADPDPRVLILGDDQRSCGALGASLGFRSALNASTGYGTTTEQIGQNACPDLVVDSLPNERLRCAHFAALRVLIWCSDCQCYYACVFCHEAASAEAKRRAPVTFTFNDGTNGARSITISNGAATSPANEVGQLITCMTESAASASLGLPVVFVRARWNSHPMLAAMNNALCDASASSAGCEDGRLRAGTTLVAVLKVVPLVGVISQCSTAELMAITCTPPTSVAASRSLPIRMPPRNRAGSCGTTTSASSDEQQQRCVVDMTRLPDAGPAVDLTHTQTALLRDHVMSAHSSSCHFVCASCGKSADGHSIMQRTASSVGSESISISSSVHGSTAGSGTRKLSAQQCDVICCHFCGDPWGQQWCMDCGWFDAGMVARAVFHCDSCHCCR